MNLGEHKRTIYIEPVETQETRSEPSLPDTAGTEPTTVDPSPTPSTDPSTIPVTTPVAPSPEEPSPSPSEPDHLEPSESPVPERERELVPA